MNERGCGEVNFAEHSLAIFINLCYIYCYFFYFQHYKMSNLVKKIFFLITNGLSPRVITVLLY